MNQLRELIEAQPQKMTSVDALIFIDDVKKIDAASHRQLIAHCDYAAQDIDVVAKATLPLHYEQRAKELLKAVDGCILREVVDYINDKKADFEEEDEAEIMDDEDPKKASWILAAWDQR